LADVEAVITNMEFRFDAGYSADACVAAITFQPDEGEGEAQEQLYSCGKGWEPVDRGAGAAHVSGRDLNFNKNSNYGRFLGAAFALDGFLDEVREDGVLPTDVNMFLGKRFLLGTVEYSTRNPSKTDSDETVKTAIVAVDYLGYEGEEEEEEEEEVEEVKPARKKAAAKKAPAKKAAATKAKGPSAVEKKQLALVESLRERWLWSPRITSPSWRQLWTSTGWPTLMSRNRWRCHPSPVRCGRRASSDRWLTMLNPNDGCQHST